MKPAAARYAVYAQACLYIGLIFCIVIRPKGLTINGGISYYGIYLETIIPYVFALLGASFFCIKAAGQCVESDLKPMKYSLTIVGILVIGVMVTPDSISVFMDDAHQAFGIALFVLQLLLSSWLIMQLRRAALTVVFTTVELAGGIASFIWLYPSHGYLLESQVVFQAGFGALLIYASNRLTVTSG